jgi:type IV pilus assembly protein PilZ
MTVDESDRRREQRAPIELKVEYKRLNTFFYDYTKNISKGGTFIKTDKPLDIGTVFLFRLQLPAQLAPLAFRGEVRWVVRKGEPLPPGIEPGHDQGMGIRFVYDNAEQRLGLERTVEKMMVDSLGQLIYSQLVKERIGDQPPDDDDAHDDDDDAEAAPVIRADDDNVDAGGDTGSVGERIR